MRSTVVVVSSAGALRATAQRGWWDTAPSSNYQTSLVDTRFFDTPKVSNAAGAGIWTPGDPFVGVQSSFYWSATENDPTINYAWVADLTSGFVFGSHEGNLSYVWPVRSGQ